jgi:hypothetical protein
VRGKDDRVASKTLYEPFMVCIDDSTWFLKACLCSSCFSFLVIFRAFSWNFRGEVLGAFL